MIGTARKIALTKLSGTLILLLVYVSCAFAAEEADRVALAGQALQEIFNSPNALPENLVQHALCIMIFPSVKKGAFGVGGTYGRGVMLCRSGAQLSGPWGPPALYALEGHNVKFPGGRDTDFVLLVMDSSSARSLLSSRVKLGSDVSVAAGYNADARNPAPPEAAIESAMNSQILSYSRNGGAFTGISLAGSTLRSDTNADQKLYGKRLTAKEILVDHKVSVASSARQLVNLLNVRAPSSQPQ